ncbi:xylulokinase [Georgenia yuyongxinii]
MRLIAHDLGTSGNKASLHDETGRILDSATVSYPTLQSDGGVSEQDPAAWVDAVGRAMRELLAKTGTAAADVAGIVLSGHMQGLVLIDADLEPIGPAMLWSDQRAHREVAEIASRVSPEQVYRTTGHPLTASYTLPKLLWVSRHQPERLHRAAAAVQAKDFVAAALTRTVATDPSDASGTLMMVLTEDRWWTELLDELGLPGRLMPDIQPSTSVVGRLTPGAAALLGLGAGTPVVLGGGDGPIASVGAASLDATDSPYLCLGTSAWAATASDAPLLDPQQRSVTFRHVTGPGYAPTATMQAAGASLAWYAHSVAGTTVEDALASLSPDSAADLGLYYLPHLMGERAPLWDPDVRGAFIGLAAHHGPGNLARAVLEGVAFNLAACWDAVRPSSTHNRLRAIGGGARSHAWLGTIADALGVPVTRVAVTHEANSLGAAVTGLVGLGVLPDFSAARALVTEMDTVAPGRTAAWRSGRRTEFDRLQATLRPFFHDVARRREAVTA